MSRTNSCFLCKNQVFIETFASYIHIDELFFGSYFTQSTKEEENLITHGGLGGNGGGALHLVARHVVMDGSLSANGQDGASQSTVGGGSGGSLWLECEDLSGFGTFKANGGRGSPKGGGGGGGRIAVYYQRLDNFDGIFVAKGGDSESEVGGAGTVYLEHRNNSVTINNTLIVDNKLLKYPLAIDKSKGHLHNLLDGLYHDISQVGGVTWLIEYRNHSFTRVDIRGNAHVAVLWHISLGDIEFRSQTLTGDTTGVLHLGRQQLFGFLKVNLYFPLNCMVYANGKLEIPKNLNLRNVWMEVNGTISDSEEYVIDKNGALYIWSTGKTRGYSQGFYHFVNLTVRSSGKLYTTTLQGEPILTVNGTKVVVNAGGVISGNSLRIESENITVDMAGMTKNILNKYFYCPYAVLKFLFSFFKAS